MAETFIIDHKYHGRERVYSNLLAFLSRIFLACNRSYKIEISEYKKSRSNAQNAALFGHAYVILSRDTGFTPDELHEAFCRRFFGTVERDIGGIKVSKPYRTTTTNDQGKRDVMDARSFSEFFEMVVQIAAEAGVNIPPPDPFRHGAQAP